MILRTIWRKLVQLVLAIMKPIKAGLEYIVSVCASLVKIPKVVNQASYALELPRKCVFKRYLENIWWAFAYGETNEFYNLYMQDLVGAKCVGECDYKDDRGFFMERQRVNRVFDAVYSYVAMLRDKYLMSAILERFGIPTPKNLAIIKDGHVFDHDGKSSGLDVILGSGKLDVFLKRVDGECADSVYHITDRSQLSDIDLTRGKYIIQDKLIQDERMNALWGGCINTCRIVTLYVNGEVRVLSAVLRVGNQKTGYVDNWAKGGWSVGIHEGGKLDRYGYPKPGYGPRGEVHPDTGIRLSEFYVPEYDRVIALCKRAHLCFSDIPAIGWDIAITDHGPVIVEGNDNWELSLMQASNHGYKREWNDFVSRTPKYECSASITMNGGSGLRLSAILSKEAKGIL